MTGIFVKKLLQEIKMYKWQNDFTSKHEQYQDEMINGNFFSPELMVASDINSQDIQKIWEKYEKCNQHNCYDAIYKNFENKEYLRPPLKIINQNLSYRTEL